MLIEESLTFKRKHSVKYKGICLDSIITIDFPVVMPTPPPQRLSRGRH